MSQAIAGFESQLYIDVGGGNYTRIGEMKEVTMRIERDQIDVSSHSSVGWKDHIHGLAQWSATSNYLYIQTDTVQGVLWNALIDRTILHFRFRGNGDNADIGDEQFEGDGIITSWEASGPNTDAVAVAINVLGSGALSKTSVT